MANIASALLILVLAAPAAYAATTYTVGDSSGWSTTFGDYTTWVSGKTFTVGDSLLFKYSSTHTVAEVSKDDYDGCSTSNLGKTYTDGSSTVPLSTAGPMYFICPTSGHCSGGMKLAITVVAASGTPSTPTTPPVDDGSTTPPTTSGSPPTAPSTTVTPPPPSKADNGATSILYNMMLGVFLVFGTTVALMGQ